MTDTTTDRTALRDRIAAAIWERQNPGRRWADCEYRWRADAEADADAVLAVLPTPADRAAVLREAAEALDNSERLRDFTDDHMSDIHEAANELRRMADETPAAEGHRLDPADEALENAMAAGAYDEPAAGTRQDGAQP